MLRSATNAALKAVRQGVSGAEQASSKLSQVGYNLKTSINSISRWGVTTNRVDY